MKDQPRQSLKTRRTQRKRVRFARSVRGGYVMKKKSVTKSKRSSSSSNKKTEQTSNLSTQTPPRSSKSKRLSRSSSFLRKSINDV